VSLKLSDLSPDEVKPVGAAEKPAKGGLRLSDLSPDEVSTISEETSLLPSKNSVPYSEQASDALRGALLQGVVDAGQAVDSYTGAPTRAGLMELRKSGNPLSAAGSFAEQFGEDPSKAPTGKDIAKELGASDELKASLVFPQLKDTAFDVTPAGLAGAGIDLGADVSNALPIGPAAKAIGKVGSAAVKRGVPIVTRAGADFAGALAQGAGKGVDAVTNSKIGSDLVDVGGNIIESATRAVDGVVNPKRAANWDEIVRIAKENGIDPASLSEALEFGPESFIARATRNVAEGPAGQAALTRHNEGLKGIERAVEAQASRLSGGGLPDEVAAGRMIRDGIKAGDEQFWKGIDLTHEKVIKDYAPGLRVDGDEMAAIQSKVNGIEKYAKGQMARALTPYDKAGLQTLLRAVETFKKSPPKNYKQMHEQLQAMGSYAFGPARRGDVPIDKAKFRDLYFTINDSLINTVRKHVNPEFADEIIANNKAMSDRLRNAEIVDPHLADNVSDEAVFKGLTRDTLRVKSLKQAMTPEAFEKFKGAYVANLIPRNADNSISFAQLARRIENNREILKEVLDPEQMKRLEEITQLGVNFGPAVLSSSGTGASLGFKDLAKGVSRGVVNGKVIEKMKDRARNPVKEAIKAKRGMSEAGETNNDFLTYVLGRSVGKREGSIDQAAKAAQFLSVGAQTEENRVKEAIRKRRGGNVVNKGR
jgi:hypothetical protein